MTTDGSGIANRFVIDTVVSRFTVRAFAGGMLSALGHNPTFAVRDYNGEVVFDSEALTTASLVVKVRAASLSLVDNVSQSDRKTIEKTMQDEVLESAIHPEITFVSEKASLTPAAGGGQFSVSLNGKLTLHGVTEPLLISARVAVTGNMLRAFGEFTIGKSEYRIKPVSVGGRMLKVKDELLCTFDIVAKR